MDVRKDIRFRVYVTFSCICFLGLAVLVKAAMIQSNEGVELRDLSEKVRLKPDTLEAERGNIYSEDGLLLCSSIPQFSAFVDFVVIPRDTFETYVDTLSHCLANLFKDATAYEYKYRLRKAYQDSSRYYSLKRNMEYYDYQALRSFPIFNKGSRRGGLIVETKIKRTNPYGIMALRTIGLWRTIWKDKQKRTQTIGLEATYDSVLSGINGSRMVQKQTGSTWMPIPGTEVDPQNGKDVITTLDFNIQEVAEQALKKVLEQYECLYGTCVVMEVQTGKIRAMANLGLNQKTGQYYEDENYAMRLAEPGSTFKLATLISLLDDGYINVNDIVDCENGEKRFANRVMHDSHHGLNTIPIREAFAQSSNVAMASLAHRFYAKNPEKYIRHLQDLHLTSTTGIDLIGEVKPVVIRPEKKGWNATTLPWMATGYGIMVSPLHVCMLYNALANDGKMMKPYLVSEIREYGKTILKVKPTVLEESIVKKEAIAQLKKCTEEVVLSGTGKHIQSPYYSIAGKTGTAQVADRIKGQWYGYKEGIYQGSFVGYFPADKPRYTIAVVIRTKPHSSSYYGGTLAAPVFRMVSDKIFSTGLGSWDIPLDSVAQNSSRLVVAKTATPAKYSNLFAAVDKRLAAKVKQADSKGFVSLTADEHNHNVVQQRANIKGAVPDVTGMGLRDAVYVLEQKGLRVRVSGTGTVRSQSILPGNKISKGQTIYLQLS